MDRNLSSKSVMISSLLVALGQALPGAANAMEVYLCAGPTTLDLPGGVSVPVWGYGPDSSTAVAGDACAAQVPGPRIEMPAADAGDDQLIVHLRNELPAPTSIVISGQNGPLVPVFFTDGQGRQRVQSFTAETAAGATGTYDLGTVSSGTHTYQSGTHVQVQVQMGLYGGVTKDQTAGMVYDAAGTAYDQAVDLFYSEIDPALHAAVADGTYGTAPGPTSTVDYHPKYFLVNGAPYEAGVTPPVGVAPVGQKTLLRLSNMGLRTVAPTLLGGQLTLVGEDAALYPYPRVQNTVMLSPSKTVDALFEASAEGSYAFFDRRLNLTNAGSAPGGDYRFLQVSAANPDQPVANPDSYSVAEDSLLTEVAPGVLLNDTAPNPLTAVLVSPPTVGTVNLAADGSFDYTPPLNYNGTTSFTYKATDGALESAAALVTISVTPVNDAPVATGDSYAMVGGTTLTVAAPGVLGNDSDVDGDALTAVLATGPANGSLTLNADGSFSYTPNALFSGQDSFTYTTFDGTAPSGAATVTIDVSAPPANEAPVANSDYATTTRGVAVDIDVLANDTDANGNIDPTTVTITSQPSRRGGSVSVNPTTGVVTFTPRNGFAGSTVFAYTVADTDGAVSNTTTVQVDVTR